jgi:hypothetical protein
MSDTQTSGNERKKKWEKMAGTPFFTFSGPYLDFLDKGKIFNFIYIVMAVANLIIPFVVLYQVIDSGFFSYGAKYVFAFIFIWLSLVFSCWIGFQLWWNRRKKVINIGSSEFIATPIFSELLQTFGEWLGTMVGITGALGGLLASIFLGKDVNYLFRAIGMGFMQYGVLSVVIGPVIGFFIIIIFRFFAEQLRLLASLVNNTKDIAVNLKNSADDI